MIEKSLNKITDFIGSITAIVMLLMMVNVFFDVVARYAFSNSSVGMQELEWHLFSVMFLFGIVYALKEEAHVRVDFIYDRLSDKKRAVINILGTILFLLPFTLLIIFGSYEYVYDAYEIGEISEDPGGLTHRWIIKAMIPLSFIFLLLTAIGYILKNIRVYKGESA
ncbi:MAG: TRAP transporter small permease subunit [Campylobacterota bacterium]|nr:TRAP transporter small permease subunit [Campylobacterota bacterium]